MVVACMAAATTPLPGAVGPRRLARGAGQSRTRIGLVVRVLARHSTPAGRDAASRVTPRVTRPRVAMTGRPGLQVARAARVRGMRQSRARTGPVLARRPTQAGRARVVP